MGLLGSGVRIRATWVAVAAIAAAVLLATPGAGSSSIVPGRCCFRVAVDVYYDLGLEYFGTADGAFKGGAEVTGGWSTRFIAAYTGGGLSVGGEYGDALVSSDQAWGANYDVLSNPPGTPEHVSQHVSCFHFSGSPPLQTSSRLPKSHWGAASTSPFERVAASGGLALAVKGVNGYARGLQVADPVAGSSMTCGLEEGPAYFGLSWNVLTVKAPSVDNFLAGQRFSRVCARGVSGSLDHPFPQAYDGVVVVLVRFTHFSRNDLAEKRRALNGLDGTTPALSDAANNAVNYVVDYAALHGQTSSCS